MPIKVIVAGLPRTGTTSTCKALAELGIKTMHMDACIENPKLMAAWQEVYAKHLEEKWTSEDWRSFFEKRFPGFEAGIDCPFADFVVEIAQAYPEAKVILQCRDPGKWFLSFQRLLKEASFSPWEAFCIRSLPGVYALHRLMKDRLRWWEDVYDYPSAGKQIMPFYIHKIKSSIATERIMIYKVEDGWKPLCEFLGKETPTIDFPKLNDARSSAHIHNEWKNEGLQTWIKWLQQVFFLLFIFIIMVSIY